MASDPDRAGRLGRALGVVAFPWAMILYSKAIYLEPLPALSTKAAAPRLELAAILLLILFFFALASLAARRWKAVLGLSASLGPAWALLAWAGLSLLWSAHPRVSLLGLAGMAGVTGYGILFSFYYRLEEQLRLIALYLLAAALASLFLVLFFPGQGVMSGVHEGAWKGIFGQKNPLGVHAAFGVVVFALCLGTETRRRPLLWAGLLACAALLAGSRSLTGVFSALAGLTSLAAARSLGNPPRGIRRKHAALAWVAAGAITCFWLLGQADDLLEAVGRDRTLSKRTEIWSVLLEKASLRPWQGQGLNAFWVGGRVGVSGEVRQALGFNPLHAHNGLLDLYLELGLVGVAIFLVCLGRAGAAALRRAVAGLRSVDCWYLVFLVFLVACNLTESRLFRHTSLFWMLFVTAACNLFGRPGLCLPPGEGRADAPPQGPR